ncbi:MAG: FkbM family methyltransferase [Betaproteobacteria bacterium]
MLLHRLLSPRKDGNRALADLPWGLSMEVNPDEAIGRALLHTGLFDISAAEVMFRLLDEDETVIDVGANIGFMTAAALSARRSVNVIAFEPHPQLFDRLARNRAMWTQQRPDTIGRLRLEQAALSDKAGSATLHVSDDFATNQGIASLESPGGTAGGRSISVKTLTFDEYVTHNAPIGLVKIDTEGHEHAVLAGARTILEKRQVRDILFEDHVGFDSAVCKLLSDLGYTIFFVAKLPWRPWLCDRPEAIRLAKSISFDSPNFLATLDPDRARLRMSGFGYRCKAAA